MGSLLGVSNIKRNQSTGAAASQCVTPRGVRQFGGLWGGGGDPHPPPKGGGGPLPPPLVDPNPAPFPAGPVQARKHTKLTRCTVNGHCFAALQHFQSSIECCLEFAQRPLLPHVTNHRHICREAKGATDRGAPPLQSGGLNQKWPTKWANWLPHPCRIGEPLRFKAGD